jgi:hypothetical protein
VPLYSLSDKDLRDHCRRGIEAFELWARRLIHQKLAESYGINYLDAICPDGARLVKKDIAEKLTSRVASDPMRFPAPIDAALLEETISLICNPELYKKYFAEALSKAFPDGREEARTFLMRLVPIRNSLSHSNPISVHDAYRVLCYTHDFIQSIKAHNEAMNTQQQFNAPRIIRVIDSLGHAVSFSSANRHPDGPGMLDYSSDGRAVLYCGDTLSIEVDVDPTFDPSTYEINWLIANIGGPPMQGPKFVLLLEQRYVSTRLCVVCRVTSNAKWHKLGSHDDQIDIAYRVLPPN